MNECQKLLLLQIILKSQDVKLSNSKCERKTDTNWNCHVASVWCYSVLICCSSAWWVPGMLSPGRPETERFHLPTHFTAVGFVWFFFCLTYFCLLQIFPASLSSKGCYLKWKWGTNLRDSCVSGGPRSLKEHMEEADHSSGWMDGW